MSSTNTLLLAPLPTHASTHSTTASATLSAPSAPGLPDTLRARNTLPSSLASTITTSTTVTSTPETTLQSTHPLERRLASWRATQQSLHLTLMRRQYGIAAPVMRGMELNDCYAGEALIYLGGARGGMGGTGGVHGDVLRGEDWEIGGWEGVYGASLDAGMGMGVGGEWHREMEGGAGMGW